MAKTSGKRILVTGGMGFVGTAIVKQLAKINQVTVADRLDFGISPEVEPLLRGKKIEFVETDMAYLSPLFSRLAGGEFDAVVHLAALTHIPLCDQYPDFSYRSNVIPPLNLFAHSCPSTRFINFSTSSTYAPELSLHVEDASPLDPIDLYGWQKKHVEELACYYAAKRELSILNVRLANAAGRGETNPKLIGTILQQIRSGETVVELGNLTPKRDYIHIDDIAWVIESLLDRWPLQPGCMDTYNVGTGHPPISVEELFHKIASLAGPQVRLKSVAERCRSSERELLCVDSQKLKRLLPDYRPQQVDDWLASVVQDPALRISNKLNSYLQKEYENSPALLVD